MFRRLLLAPLAALFATGVPLPVHAQPAPPVLAGLWEVETGNPSGKCRIELRDNSVAGRLSARPGTCAGPLAALAGWQPQGGGFTLFGAGGRPLVTVSPSRGMMSGRMGDGSLVTLRPVRR